MSAKESKRELMALHRARTLLELCDSAMALEPDLREWFLERTCAHDAALRDDLRALLDAVDDSRGFLAPRRR